MLSILKRILRRRRYKRLLRQDGTSQGHRLDLQLSHHPSRSACASSGVASFVRENAAAVPSEGSMSSTRWSSKTVPNVISSRPVEQKPVGLRRSCSVSGVVAVSAGKKAVQRFLEGPPQLIEGDDVYLQDCKELLRMLTARRNRVPGFV